MAITIDKAKVIEVAAELAGSVLSDAEWSVVLELTGAEINVSAFGSQTKADLAARYLAAHKAVRFNASRSSGSGSSSPAGPLVGVTVGPVSKQFAQPATITAGPASSAELQTTSYGREYSRLVRLWSQRAIAL